MSDWIRNARHALRSLRRAPAISPSVVLLTGLGVGSVVTVFTVADHLFLQALPYPEADRLVFIERGSYSYPIVRQLNELTSVSGWATASAADATLIGEGDPLVIRQARGSSDRWWSSEGTDASACSWMGFRARGGGLGGVQLRAWAQEVVLRLQEEGGSIELDREPKPYGARQASSIGQSAYDRELPPRQPW